MLVLKKQYLDKLEEIKYVYPTTYKNIKDSLQEYDTVHSLPWGKLSDVIIYCVENYKEKLNLSFNPYKLFSNYESLTVDDL